MRAPFKLAYLALTPLFACSIGEAGGDSLGTSVGMESAEGNEASESASDSQGDGDGDPATGDGDGDTSGDGDGDSSGDGDGDGDASGDGDGEPNPNLTEDFRYAFSVQSGTWSKIPLVSVWDDPNAPLETEVRCATRLTHMPWLLVFGADGMLYERQGGAWQEPEPISARFPLLEPLELGGLYHLPSPNDSELETLTFVDNPTAVLYDLRADESVTHNITVETMDEPPPGPPQGTGSMLWAFEATDPSLLGDPIWWVGSFGYNDGFMYRLDAGFVWSKSPIEDNLFFGTGDEDEPNPTTVRAAWYENGPGDDDYLYMVGP